MPSVRATKTKIQRNAQERMIKTEFANHTNQVVRKNEPKPKPPREMAAAGSDGKGFAGARPGEAGRGDDGEITVRSRRGSAILDIEHDGDGVTISLKADEVAGLISGLSSALAGFAGAVSGDLIGVTSNDDGITLEITDGGDLVEILIDRDGAAGLIGRLGSALSEV